MRTAFKLLIAMCCLDFAPGAFAAPVFFVAPNIHPTIDNTLDSGWQTAVGNNFVELDLDTFPNAVGVDTLNAGAITIDVGLADGTGTTVSNDAAIFTGNYASGGGTYGTISGSALPNRNSVTLQRQDTMRFEFSTGVEGFGAWIFDDVSNLAFTMTVTEVGGGTTTSSVLSAGNGNTSFVEGFLGATSNLGITRVDILITGSGGPSDFCEVDHLQIAAADSVAVPEPASGLVLVMGLAGLAAMRRRQSEKGV